MALTVTSRPSKTIDGNSSSWNCANLPIQYKLNSDLFPVNSSDPIINILSFANNEGYLQVNLAATSTTTLRGEYISISGCDVDSYNTTWRIKTVLTTSTFVLEAAYNASITTGDFQKYYINYFAEVKVYGGLPSWHADHLSNPIVEVGTLKVIPNVDNDIIASFSGIIKADINFSNQLSEGIELSSFTGFYIQWREGYDKNELGLIETYYSDWVIDEASNCGNNIVTNGDFDTDLSGWTQSGTGVPFSWSSGSASVVFNAYWFSQYLTQPATLYANVEYLVQSDLTINSGGCTYKIFGSNDLVTYDELTNDYVPSTPSLSVSVIPSKDYQYIAVHFTNAQYQSTIANVDNISITPVVCERLFWGSNSSLQFQNIRGGNMYDHIARDLDSKFMTNFDTPTIFSGEYFDTSIILDSSNGSDLDISSIADMWLVASDIGQGDGTSVTSWIDRTGNVTVSTLATQEPIYRTSGINGVPSVEFNGVNQFFETNINKSQPFILYVVFNSRTKGNILDTSNANRMALFLTSTEGKIALLSDGNSMVDPNVYTLDTDSVIKAVVDDGDSSLYVDNELVDSGDMGTIGLVDTDIGKLGAAYFNGQIAEMIVVPLDTDPCKKWQIDNYLGNKYGTYNTNAFGYVQNEYDSTGALLRTKLEDIVYTDTGVYRIKPTYESDVSKIDIQLASGDSCVLSELKEFNVNSECSNQEIYLTWLNVLGGWDYWKFTAEKDYNLNIESKDTIKRNIFADWDNTFSNGDTEIDVINSEAYKSIGVFSQYLNPNELETISAIKYSPKVQVLNGSKLTTVLVDKDNILLYNDGDEESLYTIRFNIQLPNIQSQSQ